jgi:glycosyltransferase involved in cell wall biosynthesis
MKFSIVIVSYNQAFYLEDTIKSVVNQNYSEKEIILIDGGSSDNSIDIIKKYADEFTYWVSEKDNGQSEAIIKGFKLCSGELITWVNSDDILMPNVLNIVANKARKVKDIRGVFYGGSYIIDSSGNQQDRSKSENVNKFVFKHLGPVICQPGTFFNRTDYNSIGGINKLLLYGMDYDLFCNFLFSGYPFYFTGKYHAQFRKHSSQKGHSKKYLEQCNHETILIKQKYGLNNVSVTIKIIARLIQIFSRIFNGYYLDTLFFRYRIRKSFTEFKTKYSE